MDTPFALFPSPNLELLHILVTHIQGRKVAGLTALRPHEDAVIVRTFKIPLSFDGPVVLACRLVEGNPDPKAYFRNVRHLSDVGYCSSACV